MGKGDGKSRRGGGRAVSVLGVSGRDISHSSRRNAAYLEVIGPLQAAASGGAGRARVSQRRFHAQRVVPLPHGSSVERVGTRGEICYVRVCPPAHVPRKTRAPRSDAETVRGRTFHPFVSRAPGTRLAPSTNIRVKRRSVYATCPRARVPIARPHLGIGLHTSANVGRLAGAAAGDPGDRRSDPDSSSMPPPPPFSTPPSPTGVRPSTVSLRPTSLMRSLIVALTLRSRFPLTIARSSGHLNGRVFDPEPRIPRTHSRQNE